MFKALRKRIRRLTASWIARRSPRQSGPIRLHRRRLFILPTRGGTYFGVLVFVMLLGAMNYSNSLGFVLTFLLAGVSLVCMHHTHRNLLGLRIHGQPPDAVFAGGRARFGITIDNPGTAPRYAVRVNDGEDIDAGTVDVPAGSATSLSLPVPVARRGRFPMPRLRIETEFPMGLFRAWSWVHLDLECIVYPAPRGRAPLPAAQTGDETGHMGLHAGNEDFAGLRRYARGDPPRLIHWKAYPRTGELMTKQFHDPRQQRLWLDWRALAPLATEARLSQLTRWVLEAEDAGMAYGLHLPDEEIPPAHGTDHRAQCLRKLALFEDGRAA